MSELIQDNEGTIDKYIGDAIMAIWNAPRAVVAHEVKACESALLYQSRLDVANLGA
jgi:adenylate cyclase